MWFYLRLLLPSPVQCYLIVVFRSPQAYSDLQASGALTLPSKRLLQYYKNSVDQATGINTRQLEWMQKEAISKKVSEFGKRGGLVIDEMSIQDDIQVKEGLYFSFILRFRHLCMLPGVHSRLKLLIKVTPCAVISSGGSFICGEAVGSRRAGSDEELKRTLQKLAPSWTVLG